LLAAPQHLLHADKIIERVEIEQGARNGAAVPLDLSEPQNSCAAFASARTTAANSKQECAFRSASIGGREMARWVNRVVFGHIRRCPLCP
jgi:hypothetical protein